MNYGESGGLSASDVALLTGRSSNGGGGFGDGYGSWLIIIFVILALLGWGGNGFGNNSGNGGSGGATMQYIPYNVGGGNEAVQRGFDNQAVINKLNGLENGLCDGFYAVNTSILNLGQTLLQCCCDTKMAIMQNGYETRDAINMNSNAIQAHLSNGFNSLQHGFCDLGYKLQDCCCTTQRSIDNVRFDLAQLGCGINNTINNSTRDILESNNANTRAILDFLTKDKIDTLQAENQALRFQASQTAQNAFITANQDAQTAELIRRLGADSPVPAYVVQPNTPVSFPTNCCGQFTGFNNNGYNNGCGCNCGNY